MGVIKDIMDKIDSYKREALSEVRDLSRNVSGATILGNQAYEQYERVSGTRIIRRDEFGNYLTSSDTGQYLLSTSSRDNEIDAFRHAYTSARIARDYGQEFAHFTGDLVEGGENWDICLSMQGKFKKLRCGLCEMGFFLGGGLDAARV